MRTNASAESLTKSITAWSKKSSAGLQTHVGKLVKEKVPKFQAKSEPDAGTESKPAAVTSKSSKRKLPGQLTVQNLENLQNLVTPNVNEQSLGKNVGS